MTVPRWGRDDYLSLGDRNNCLSRYYSRAVVLDKEGCENGESYDGEALYLLNQETLDRLVDLRESGKVNDQELASISSSIESGEITLSDTKRISKVLTRSRGRPGEGTSVDRLISIGDGETVEPENTVTVNGRQVDQATLNLGDRDSGFIHFLNRHVYGLGRDRGDGVTTLWPMGQTIAGKTMDKTFESPEEVTDAIKTAIRRGNPLLTVR